MTFIRTVLSLSLLIGLASPAAAQLGGLIDQGAKRAKQVSDFKWSDEEKAEPSAPRSARSSASATALSRMPPCTST